VRGVAALRIVPVFENAAYTFCELRCALLHQSRANRDQLAAAAAPDRQLKCILALLMLTRARTSKILNTPWSDIDSRRRVAQHFAEGGSSDLDWC
jgi:integrase